MRQAEYKKLKLAMCCCQATVRSDCMGPLKKLDLVKTKLLDLR